MAEKLIVQSIVFDLSHRRLLISENAFNIFAIFDLFWTFIDYRSAILPILVTIWNNLKPIVESNFNRLYGLDYQFRKNPIVQL